MTLAEACLNAFTYGIKRGVLASGVPEVSKEEIESLINEYVENSHYFENWYPSYKEQAAKDAMDIYMSNWRSR